MSQKSLVMPANQPGINYRLFDTDRAKAVSSFQLGNAAPVADMRDTGSPWWDDNAVPWQLKVWNGAAFVVLLTFNPSTGQVAIPNSASMNVPPATGGDEGKYLKVAGGNGVWSTILVAALADATAFMKGLLTTIADAAGFRAAIGAAEAARTAFLDTVNVFTKAQRITRVALTASTASAIDFSAGNYFKVTLDVSYAVPNPTNQAEGQAGHFIFMQDGTGGKLVTWGSNFKWPAATAPVVTGAANAIDVIPYYVNAAGVILMGQATQDIK